ncbi:hypothetical protein Dvina_17170 [Dactylosporangium vinaceum]|nr:hypothetical protein [Dactylosporangium vinaceum]UAB99645.1 hypothetical protein Dvina_17170 [Dactylosporangium vinaceum]
MDRRHLLRAAALVGGAATVGVLVPAGAAQAAPQTWRSSRSANGWPVLPHAATHTVEGSGVTVALADGDPATILTYVARRFHYELQRLRTGDIRGHSTSRQIATAYESNYLSGSAIAIRPLAYPIGVRGGFYPHELVVLQDILTDLDGAVVWGGELDPPKESHVQIAAPPGHPTVRGAARRIASWNAGPKGAGTIDAFDPARLARAQRRR